MGIARMRCPSCGRVGYKPYINPDGTLVDETCGRCDHESSCGYHKKPSEMKGEVSLVRCHHIAEGQTPYKPKKAISIEHKYVTMRLPQEGNTLINYLRSQPLNIKQRMALDQMLKLYMVGTTRPDGDTIWWQEDEHRVVRSGKIMRYKPDGHRDKNHWGGWIHSRMIKAGMIDGSEYEYVGCLFGQHLLPVFPNAEVGIVESEKSALICSIFSDPRDKIWMAVGGLSLLNEARLLPLIQEKRIITVYPDHDGYEKWMGKVSMIGYDHITVNNYVERAWREGDPDNADVADILLRKMGENDEEKLADMARRNPAVGKLVDNLKLEVT